jgi:hypothetical protein
MNLITRNRFIALFGFLALAHLIGCSPMDPNAEQEQRQLAKVHNKTLYLSELEGMIPGETNPEDSALIINAYIARWVREAVLMHEAEQNVPQDLNIDELVRDYRASLIRNNYEKILIEQLLDSTVTNQELEAFYQKNREAYRLQAPIVRCRYIKVPQSAPELNKAEKWWESKNEDDFKLLVAYCNNYAQIHLLEDSTWYELSDLEATWSPDLPAVGSISVGKKLLKSDDQFTYFFELIDRKNKNDYAPLSYVSEQANKVILHRRKMALLDETIESMYERALRRNEIQVYPYE